MDARDSRAEYERRSHRVMAHVDQHLGEALDLSTLASIARFSPFHFHRLFVAWTGETLGGYLRRRRVESAALRLLRQPSLGVLTVATEVGFGSGEAFTRAFKVRFGLTPSAWRSSKSNLNQTFGSNSSQNRQHSVPDERPTMRFIEQDPIEILYLRQAGPFGERLGRFWDDIVMPRLADEGLLGQARFGLVHDDPEVTDVDRCRYDAGCEFPTGRRPSARWLRTAIPGGHYAVHAFEGTSAEAPVAWYRLLRDWLPSSGLQLDARPCVERYAGGAPANNANGSFRCDMWLPVVPL